MRVMHLLSTNSFSGAENVACQIINLFDTDKNYNMIYCSEVNNELKKILNGRNIEYLKLEKFNYKNIKRAVKEYNPDIIHAHDIRASIVASFFSKKCTIISHIHSNHENMRKINLKTILYNYATKKFKKIIWVSESSLENYYFNKKIKNKSITLYNVISAEQIKLKINEDSNNYEKFDLVYLGRLTYAKNPQRLIKILKNIIGMKSDLKVAIIGSGDEEKSVVDLIKKYGIEKNIKMFGFINNPYKILDSSKIMIMTSRYEGTPMCALEAIALGKPIVSTPTDGLRDVVDSEITGFLSDNDHEIEKYILDLLNDKEKFKKISANVLEKNKIINDLSKYKDIIENIYN